MNIVVLLKQVPDTAALLSIAEDNAGIREDDVKWVINPYDEMAVEEAVRIREKNGGGKVTTLTVGPESAATTIRTALAMGADEGILISDPALEKNGLHAIAKVISAALRTIPFDLVIAGSRAVDDDGCFVPAAVAEYLNIPLLSTVVRQEISGNRIRCEQSVQEGFIVVEASLPAIITTQRGLNEPRYPSLSSIMKAKKKQVLIKTLSDLGLSPNQTEPGRQRSRIISLTYSPKRNAGNVIIEGSTPEEKAALLIKLLRNKAVIQ